MKSVTKWFAPRCPVDLHKKTWIEWRWRWLLENFDEYRLAPHDFVRPGDVPGYGSSCLTESDAHRIFWWVADQLQISRDQVEFIVTPAEMMPENAIGLYTSGGQATIRIADSELAGFRSTVSTIVHELAHQLLLGSDKRAEGDTDEEWLTDLMTLFLGFGVFSANNTILDNSLSDGMYSYSWIAKKGYLSSQMYGYAFALDFYLNDLEIQRDWLALFRNDAAKSAVSGLRYLKSTNDCLFDLGCNAFEIGTKCDIDIANAINSPSATQRLAAIWDMPNEKSSIPYLGKLLFDAEPEIRREAIGAIMPLGELEVDTCELLERALDDKDEMVQARSGLVLAKQYWKPTTTAKVLLSLLKSIKEIAVNASHGISVLSEKTDIDPIPVIQAVVRAINNCDNGLLEAIHPALTRCKNLRHVLEEKFPGFDDELREEILALADEANGITFQPESQTN